ncbi:MAG: aspartyl-phosphate phosphatase Spo0E family protein [Ruminiclostridium sp.]|nr:aspartyl-phosphate phosphatase Spo0E family protein [Ruminiclostridium sp.]
MNAEIQKLKEKLDTMISDTPLISDEVLELSRELDIVINNYYRQ